MAKRRRSSEKTCRAKVIITWYDVDGNQIGRHPLREDFDGNKNYTGYWEPKLDLPKDIPYDNFKVVLEFKDTDSHQDNWFSVIVTADKTDSKGDKKVWNEDVTGYEPNSIETLGKVEDQIVITAVIKDKSKSSS